MKKEITITGENVKNNPELVAGEKMLLDLDGEEGGCPLPMPTRPPAGYSPNSTVYCDHGEWKWINGEVAE